MHLNKHVENISGFASNVDAKLCHKITVAVIVIGVLKLGQLEMLTILFKKINQDKNREKPKMGIISYNHKPPFASLGKTKLKISKDIYTPTRLSGLRAICGF